MLDPNQIEELVRRMTAGLPKGVQALQEDLSRNLRASLESGLGRLDLVTREEFDVQTAVLARTRSKLEALQVRVAELEAAAATARSSDGPTDTPTVAPAGTGGDAGG